MTVPREGAQCGEMRPECSPASRGGASVAHFGTKRGRRPTVGRARRRTAKQSERASGPPLQGLGTAKPGGVEAPRPVRPIVIFDSPGCHLGFLSSWAAGIVQTDEGRWGRKASPPQTDKHPWSCPCQDQHRQQLEHQNINAIAPGHARRFFLMELFKVPADVRDPGLAAFSLSP